MLVIVTESMLQLNDHDTHALVNIEKVVQDDIALSFIETDDLCCEGSVHKQRLPAGGRVYANDRMNKLDVRRTGIRIIAVEIGMRGLEVRLLAVNDLAEARTELLVSSIARSPQGISTDSGYNIIVEMCDTCRLTLVDQISVPARSSSRISEVGGSLGCL